MAALDFPSSPTLNQIYSANGKAWIWDGVVWNAYSGAGGNSITTSATAPLNPSNGDLWFNTENGLVYVYYVDENSQQWVAPDNSGGVNGKVAQVVVASTSNSATTTVIFPPDDTIPQITEGAEFITATITPTNANSQLVIEFDTWGSVSVIRSIILALFKDNISDAIASVYITNTGANYATLLRIKAVVSAESTTPRIYRLRYGADGAGTCCILRTVTGNALGSSDIATLTITEILP